MTTRKDLREAIEEWERANTLAPNEERIRARDSAREEGRPRLSEFQLRRIRRVVDGAGKAYGGIGGLYVDASYDHLTDEEQEEVVRIFDLARELHDAAKWLAIETGAIPSEDF